MLVGSKVAGVFIFLCLCTYAWIWNEENIKKPLLEVHNQEFVRLFK